MTHMTASTLKFKVQRTGSHFFDRDSMRFFGDTMSNYYVSRYIVGITDSMGDIHQCYALTRRHAVKDNQQGTAYFDTETFEHIIPSDNPVRQSEV